MDMIYANSSMVDIGVLQDYSLDMEYGKGEGDTNTFEVKIQKYNPAMQGDTPITQDFLLYVEFTEYGGIVDRVEVDVKSGEVTLKGRTWHGVLNGKIITPPQGEIYRTYSGEANSVISQIISDVGLGNLFVVDNTDSGIRIVNYQVRYKYAYDAIMDMLEEENGKMYCYFQNNKVHIGALLSVNYAVSDEIDSSQVPYQVGKTYNNINHMICLGQGEGTKRAVIHLFTNDMQSDDFSDTLQPYKLVADPKQDSDYILNTSQQVFFGKDEIAYIYDFPSAEITENFLPLTQEPSNWKGVYVNYYQRKYNSDIGRYEYTLLERTYADKMKLTRQEPPDWRDGTKYQKYYYSPDNDGTSYQNVSELSESEARATYTPNNGYRTVPPDWNTADVELPDGTHVRGCEQYWEKDGLPDPHTGTQRWKRVTKESGEKYKVMNKIPYNWTWMYSSYYYRTWNGYEWVYSTYSAVFDHYEYKPKKGQTKKPSDWNNNWRGYYTKLTAKATYGKVKKKKGSWVTCDFAVNAKVAGMKLNKSGVLKWKKNTFYSRVEVQKAPAWSGSCYIKETFDKSPTFIAGRYYTRTLNTRPLWRPADMNANPPFWGYWEKYQVEVIPTFVPNKYFYVVYDRYRVLVENALEKFESLCDTSTLNVDLDVDSDYDVGDLISGVDELTGIEVNKNVVRKIIKIKKDIVSVEYQVDN